MQTVPTHSQNAANDQCLHCLLTGIFIQHTMKIKKKKKKLPETPITYYTWTHPNDKGGQVCVCVYSSSRNDIPRVAQRYGTIAAHTWRRVSVLVVRRMVKLRMAVFLSPAPKRVSVLSKSLAFVL